jgi:hypothetical protein
VRTKFGEHLCHGSGRFRRLCQESGIIGGEVKMGDIDVAFRVHTTASHAARQVTDSEGQSESLKCT